MDEEMMLEMLAFIMPLIVWCVFFIIGIGMYKNEKKKQTICTVKVLGKVKDMVKRESYGTDDTSSSAWHPVFEYKVGNENIVKESRYGTFRPRYEVGQEIEIYYNPENVEEYYINETLPKKFSIIISGVGVFVMIMAVIVQIII